MTDIQDKRNQLPHPLLTFMGLACPGGISDALDNAACCLELLSDLFGGDVEGYKYQILEDDRARRGMFTQLTSIAHLLKAAGAAIEEIQPKKSPEEIAILLTDRELADLRKVAALQGAPIEQVARELIESYVAQLRAAFNSDKTQ